MAVPTIRKTFRALRRRYRIRVLLRKVTGCLATALIAFAVLQIILVFQNVDILSAQYLGWGLLTALIVAIVLTAMEDTTAVRAARKIEEHEPELHSILSTAAEVSAAGTPAGSGIESALLQRVTELLAKRPDLQYISVFPTKSSIMTVALGALLCLGSMQLSADTIQRFVHTPTTASESPTSLLNEHQQAEMQAGLINLEALLADYFKDTDDLYQQAIARQVRNIGERLGTELNDRASLAAELSRLEEHIRTAVDLHRAENTNAPNQLLETLADLKHNMQQPTATTQDAADIDTAAPETTALTPEVEAAISNNQADGSDPSLPVTNGGAPQSQVASASATGTSQTTADAFDEDAWGSYHDRTLSPELVAELNAQAMAMSEQVARGEVIGASAQSQEGGSSLAGDGTDELFGNENMDMFHPDRIEDLRVSEEIDPEGRHVRIEVNPETAFTDVFATPLGETAWNRSTEIEVLRETLQTDQRNVISRYHTPEPSQ